MPKTPSKDKSAKERERQRAINERILKRIMDEHGEAFDRLAKM